MWKLFLCTISLLFFYSCSSKKRPILGESKYQIALNSVFKDASISPLKKKDLKNFNGLAFFPIDSSFIVKATFTKKENATSFVMKTTTDRIALYKEYGVVNFLLKGKNYEMTIYQSDEDSQNEKRKNRLFLPFTDATSGNESYGGGRYMDLMTTDIDEDQTIEINFNNTYNPYCVYNEKYSCPLTPRKNHVDTEITAGIKDFKK
jgi:uncharacterized protein (DUF1684 family)